MEKTLLQQNEVLLNTQQDTHTLTFLLHSTLCNIMFHDWVTES
jgi:hypothetical protein